LLVLSPTFVTHLVRFAGTGYSRLPRWRVPRKYVRTGFALQRHCPRKACHALELRGAGVLDRGSGIATVPGLQPLLPVQPNAPEALQNVEGMAHMLL